MSDQIAATAKLPLWDGLAASSFAVHRIEVIAIKPGQAFKARFTLALNAGPVGSLEIYGCTYIEGKNGAFVQLPSYKLANAEDPTRQYKPTGRLSPELNTEISNVIGVHFHRQSSQVVETAQEAVTA